MNRRSGTPSPTVCLHSYDRLYINTFTRCLYIASRPKGSAVNVGGKFLQSPAKQNSVASVPCCYTGYQASANPL